MHVPGSFDGETIAAVFAARDWPAAGTWTLTRSRGGVSHFDVGCDRIGDRAETRNVAYLGPHNIFERKQVCRSSSCQAAYASAVSHANLVMRSYEAYRTAAKLATLATAEPLEEAPLTELCTTAARLRTYLAVREPCHRYFADLLVDAWRRALPYLIERSSRSAAISLARHGARPGTPLELDLVDAWLAAAGELRVPLALRRGSYGLTLSDHLHRLGANLDGSGADPVVSAPLLVAVCRAHTGGGAGSRFRPTPLTIPPCATGTERLLLVLLGERRIDRPAALAELVDVVMGIVPTADPSGPAPAPTAAS